MFRVAIEYDNVLGCILDENGVLTKLRFLGMDDDNHEENDPLARMDAEFVLITGTLRMLLGDLEKSLGGFA
jgi:DNA recombination-dependent growth factor C